MYAHIQPHLRAILGSLSVLVMSMFLIAASYRVGMAFGDGVFGFCVCALTTIAILYGARMEGLAFSSMAAMCLSFGMNASLTGFVWSVRSLIFGVHTPFAEAGARGDVILMILIPSAVIAVIFAPLIKIYRGSLTQAEIF